MPTGYAGLNPDGTRTIAASGLAALDCNCCGETPPVCCVLPPQYIDLTSYTYVGYDLPYEDALYTFVSWTPVPDVSALPAGSPYIDCEYDPFFTPTVGFDIYKYYTPTTIPVGAYAGQTQRIIILINCDGNDFCVNGTWYYGPAQMFFADEDWNPTTHIDNVPKMETSGCILLMTSDLGVYWDAPDNADYMPEVWQTYCPSCTGSARVLFTPCPGTAGNAFVGEYPLSIGAIVIGNVYRLTLNNGFEGCFTATATADGDVPSYAITAASGRANCDDGDCAPVVCDGPDYFYRVAYCNDPLTPIGYLQSPTALPLGYTFIQTGVPIPGYIVIDCNSTIGLPPVFFPFDFEAAPCP